MGKIWRWLRAGLCFGFVVAACGARAENLVVYGDDAYAPVIHLVDGRPSGFLADLLRAAEAHSGDRYELRLVPWKRAYEMALRGQGGLIGVSATSERRERFDFSRPVYRDAIHVVVLNGREFEVRGLEDLRGRLIGGVIGASYGQTVDQAISNGLFRMDRDVGQPNRLRKLLAGRLDAALIGNGELGFEMAIDSQATLRSQRERFVMLPTPLVSDPLHLAFPKQLNQVGAIARFDAAMEKVLQQAGRRR